MAISPLKDREKSDVEAREGDSHGNGSYCRHFGYQTRNRTDIKSVESFLGIHPKGLISYYKAT